MSMADSKDGATADDAAAADANASTIDSGSRPQADANTELAPSDSTGTAAASGNASPDDIIGTILSERYEVTARIGQGGMGAVYEARHVLIGKRVALKVLLDKHAEKEQVVARLKQEARLASSIGHDNIVDITDVGTTNTGRTFVVMEYLDGESLGACISRQGRIDSARIIEIATQIASALHAAHGKGIVHRDIKPDNIFLIKREGRDFVKVVDFGISKSMAPSEDDELRLTQTGMVLGTPLYMSPEQAQGEDDLDHRIDIYALGVILYEAVTGEVPFRGKNYLNILTQVISEEPRKPSDLVANLDHNFESVILKSMAKDRGQRYQSMGDFGDDLKALADPDVKSTGARITAARWRNRRERRSKRSYAAWGAIVVGLAGASTLAVTMLMSSTQSTSVEASAQQAMATNALDAAARASLVAFDAAPKEAAFELATILLVSTPPGATVFRDSRVVCQPTPCTYKAEKTGEQIKLHVDLEGYKRGFLLVTPEVDDGATATIQLEIVDERTTRGNRGSRSNGDKKPSSSNKGPAPSDGAFDTLDVIPNPHRHAGD